MDSCNNVSRFIIQNKSVSSVPCNLCHSCNNLNATDGIPNNYSSTNNSSDMDSFIIFYNGFYLDHWKKETDSTRRIDDELY